MVGGGGVGDDGWMMVDDGWWMTVDGGLMTRAVAGDGCCRCCQIGDYWGLLGISDGH